MDPDAARALLLGASALHLGFQATITLLVYPALSRVRPEDWVAEHARHSLAVVPVVAVVYAGVLATGILAGAVADSEGVVVAVGAGLAAMVVTAVRAAPLHGRLDGPGSALVVRLIRVDRVRLLLAFVSVVGAVVAVL